MQANGKNLIMPTQYFIVQWFFEGEPLSTKIKDESLGVELGLTPTHVTHDTVRWFPILTAKVPATYAPGAPDIIVTAEHYAPVWVENFAHCGECHEIRHQAGWRIVAPDDMPDIVAHCDRCGYYNWYEIIGGGLSTDGLWTLRLSGEWVALGASPLGRVV